MWSVLSYALIFNLGSFFAAQHFVSKWQEFQERRGDLAIFLRKTLLCAWEAMKNRLICHR